MLAATCAPPAPTLTTTHRAAIVDSVQATLTAWRDAFNAKDFGRAATFYSNDPDFRWFEDGELKYRSGKEIGDTMKAEAPGFRALSVSLIEPQVTALAPGVAAVTMNFAQTITDTTGNTIGIVGAVSATMVHADSGWQFLVGHASLFAPPPGTAKPGKGPRT
jgi:ketosteroid isomerase-like protein